MPRSSQQATTSGSQPPGLTTGVEFEFFAACDYNSENVYQDKNTGYYILPTDQGQAFDVIKCEIEKVVTGGQKVHSQRPGDRRAVPDNNYDFYKRHWTVKKHESSMEATEGHSWHDVEITSPIMKPQDVSATLFPVLNRLNSTLKLCPDSSCAFQVHVGRGRGTFVLYEVLKIVTILWLGESRLDQLYARHRIREGWAVGFREYPIRKESKYGSAREPASPLYNYWLQTPIATGVSENTISPNQAGRIQAMWGAETLKVLCERMLLPKPSSHGAYFEYCAAYSFFNLVGSRDAEEPMKRTIEFRRPEGTLDPNVAVAWCKVFERIVYSGVFSDLEQFQALIGNLLNPDFAVFDFLTFIGCDPFYV
ncbi:hypothetical protein QBC44DRAFT_313616 [Cladorrhinum sp. PSN332]|nr:hypothetical protein QBC44DRAFT_313616 [Cladorrhinum sp. PSN332]